MPVHTAQWRTALQPARYRLKAKCRYLFKTSKIAEQVQRQKAQHGKVVLSEQ